MILNYSSNQQKILKDALRLYLPGEETYECDVTYGAGNFYTEMPRPLFCYDKVPRFDFVVAHESARIHELHTGTLKSIVYDPPYLHAPGKKSIMGRKFGGYKNHAERIADYRATIDSAHLALEKKGVLLIKCQDIIEGGRQMMNHCLVWEHAKDKFEVLDFFVLTSNNPIPVLEQKHSRKGTSYFWVFQKR